jgi:tetratricopeptide (TPR) repeat protein
MGYDPPKYESLRRLLEEFLQRYPDSDGVPEMRERLLRAYENSGRWEAVVALYEEIVPAMPEDHPYLLVTHLDYARALEGVGERRRALDVYQKVAAIAGGENASRYDMSDLWLRAARDRIAAIGMLEQGRWKDLVAVYREQFGNMAWAEMPHIQELLEYAEALEKTGDIAAAVTRYRQVLTTDQGYSTRQAGMARARLAALGG